MAKARARCEACGIGLPPGAVRCPTCGHAQGEPVVVAIGRTPRSQRPKRPRRDLVALGAVLVIVAAAVWASSRDSGHETEAGAADRSSSSSASTTTSSSSTTTTSTTIATTTTIPGSQLGGASGVRVVVASRSGVALVDLDTGATTPVRVDPEAQIIPVEGGFVASSTVVEFFAEPYDAPPVTLGTASVAYPAWDGDLVWLVRFNDQNFSARLVDTAAHDVAGPFTVGTPYGVVGAVRQGLVTSIHGGVYLIDRTGAARRIAIGEVIAAGGDRVLVSTCDEHLSCAMEVVDVATGRTVPVHGDPPAGYASGVISPDGRMAAFVEYDQSQPSVIVVDLDTGTATATDQTVTNDSGPGSGIAFSRDANWLFYVAGGDVIVRDMRTGEERPVLVGSHLVMSVAAI